ncbi:MAG: hypothetical protein ACRD1Z_08595, partial [Vicinamibacteria bacterium]
ARPEGEAGAPGGTMSESAVWTSTVAFYLLAGILFSWGMTLYVFRRIHYRCVSRVASVDGPRRGPAPGPPGPRNGLEREIEGDEDRRGP